ncbi:tyrosine-type recombinase/integrase [Atlantibacter hermannii]|uniref:tyrosine-type recombinase/integrase n=1 Tax=Atlantibacter hermannii TaxID=565 RepID=UPI003D6F619C
MEKRNLKKKTLANKTSLIKFLKKEMGSTPISRITPFQIKTALNHYTSQNKNSAARCAYVLLNDVFRIAYDSEIIKVNPMSRIRIPKAHVKRSRLTFDEWQRIYNAARIFCPFYFHIFMLLALVSAQRRSDLILIDESIIKDGYWFIEQQKTGAKIALPLTLTLYDASLNLGDTIKVYFEWFNGPHGKIIKPWNISRWFLYARDIAYSRDYWPGTPPSFHEQRSLAARLYRIQGVDIKTLLGHKKMSMSDHYDDDRGREYRKLTYWL